MIPKDLSIDDISIGDQASFDQVWSKKDVQAFAELCGDMNPIHIDAEYAKTTKFGRPIVHGMLLGAACSKLLGMQLPGKRCLYLKQSLTFKKPVFIDDAVTVHGIVESKSSSTQILEIKISIMKADEEVAGGTAVVQVLT